MGIFRVTLFLSFPAVLLWSAQADSAGVNCTFQVEPDKFLSAQSRARGGVFDATQAVAKALRSPTAKTDAAPIPHRSFIDDEIFDKLARVQVASAPLTTDEEFFRRITLDLTGTIASPADIRAFLTDTTLNKRDVLIDKLLGSPAFNDKWTLWLGDLLQNNATQATAAAQRQIGGRNAFYGYLYWSVSGWKSLSDIAYESINWSGSTYDTKNGAVNFIMGGSTAGGPAQDTYDGMLVRSATVFLGQGHYDCLNCHNGRGHLDQISLWGSQTTRQQAEQMSAFFSRTRLTTYVSPLGVAMAPTDPYYLSVSVTDADTTAGYDLNTGYGNRPNRVPYGALKTLTPVYQFSGATPSDKYWRTAFVNSLVADPMFARNMANRLWKQMFNLGLVDPVDQLDPLRLDPNNPPPAPWDFQATHPVLMEKLAAYLRQSGFDLRGFLKLLAQSSAYQLSSRYDGDWNVSMVPLFARHYPRRLWGEEVHDAIAQATQMFNKYTVTGFADPFVSALSLPDTVEPRSNGSVAAFMNSFLRGNRDTTVRSGANSILQQLNIMNDPFVTGRTQVSKSPELLAISKIADNNVAVDELWLAFLSRYPSDYERSRAVGYLAKAPSAAARNIVIEDLAWSAINKLDFLFSY